MNNDLVRRQAATLACLLGSSFFPLASLAAVPEVAHADIRPSAPAALMLATHWQDSLDPSEFLVSEKLDGVRAFWDGHTLRFRSGRSIAAPAWFTAALPRTALDGELWTGRGQFDKVSAAVRRKVPVDAEWHELKYQIFDLPGQAGSFAERVARMGPLLKASGVPWLQAVVQEQGSDRAGLQRQLTQLVAEGGEGLVLHRSEAPWQAGRSDALRKLKPLPDEDARVVAYQPGKGRHVGLMGALQLETPSGKRFFLGTGFTDAQREVPPTIGSVVTYRYRDRTPNGVPRFASFLRVRPAE
ncbi:DNA ligase [Rhodoferax sp. PAMC 29310]|uniref:DNA ligase n=1 Tax=Rhodoferax sp. PAMC 29310 TaxID=2822760 RepID=UPI001B340E41|nr:DNA ligase [Rhodoferax sp. PAMC 29310]